MHCPHCDADLEYEPAEPDVGIMSSGYFCTACDKFYDEEGEEQ